MKHLSLIIILAVIAIGLTAATNSLPEEIHKLYRGVRDGDKIIHFFLVGGANGAAIILFSHYVKMTPKVILLITTTTMALATMDEFIQKLVPHRTFSLKDLAANYLGIISFTLFASIILFIQKKWVDHKLAKMDHETKEGR